MRFLNSSISNIATCDIIHIVLHIILYIIGVFVNKKLFALCLMQKKITNRGSYMCFAQFFVSYFIWMKFRLVSYPISDFEPVLLFLIQYFTKPADGRSKQLVHSDQSRDAASRKDSTYFPCRFNLCILMHCSAEHHNRKFGLQQGCIYNNTASRCF